MAPTNPAEQAKQSLDSSIKRFLFEQCSGGSSRKEVSKTEPNQRRPKGDPHKCENETNLADIKLDGNRSFKKATTSGTIWDWSRRM
jgi:hypothetical protein